jgi:tRNA1Val (adenine37-N6)-methyltransferase
MDLATSNLQQVTSNWLLVTANLRYTRMANSYFKFKQFTIEQDRCAMKVTTDGCLFGAWCAEEIGKIELEDSELLDIGAGTALLSLMILQKNKLHIDAVEIEKNAAMQAEENAAASPWPDRIKIIQEDILDRTDKKYDLIISNPPFYENELRAASENRNIAHHSEKLNMRQLVEVIKKRLKQKGRFFLLLPSKRSQDVHALLEEQDLFISKQVIVRPSTKHQPFRVMIMGGQNNFGEPMFEELSIRDDDGNYTSGFVELLKDYYLYL